MPKKRDRKRVQKQRRSAQRRQTEASREIRRARTERLRTLAGELEVLAKVAVDGTEESFAGRLAELAAREPMFASPVTGWHQGRILGERVGAERALRLAGALNDPLSRWWTPGLIEGAGERARAADTAAALLYEDGEERDEEAVEMLCELRLELGQAAGAAELALELCADDPEDEFAQDLLAQAMGAMFERTSAPPGECPCGSSRPWEDCCRDREAQLLDRFASRERVYALRQALATFTAADPELMEWQAGFVSRWQDEARADEDEIDSLEPPAGNDEDQRLPFELSWTTGPEWDDSDPRRKSPGMDDDSHSILNRFAVDESQPGELRAFARTWQDAASWGLWQVRDPEQRPGLWVTDIVTGQRLYAAVAPEQLERVPRWSVLAGCFVPDGGVWRSGSAFAMLDPNEGDEAAEIAHSMADAVVGGLARERGIKAGRSINARPPRLDDVPPHGIVAALSESIDPPAARLYHTVTGIALATILATVKGRSRRGLPRMQNTDGDPLELLKATARVEDPESFLKLLLQRPEFDDDGEGTIVWQGREMTPMEAETSLAEFKQFAAAQGLGDVGELEGSRRFTRGTLSLDGDVLTIEVNSRARLDRITRLSKKLGAGEPVVERRFDPNLDMAVPAGWRPIMKSSSPESEEAWLHTWLDEKVPALHGKSPREAVGDVKGMARLEKLLRSFEFDSDLASFEGDRGVDVAKIRLALAGEDGTPFGL